MILSKVVTSANIESECLVDMFWEEIKELDLEGRCVVTVHADFVLFNVYAPALTIETEIEDRMRLKVKWFQVPTPSFVFTFDLFFRF